MSLRIASSFNWHRLQYRAHFSLATLFIRGRRFDDAHPHVERAKSHTAGSAYDLGVTVMMQAMVWYGQHKFEEARSEVLRATDIFERLGAVDSVESCRTVLLDICIRQILSGPVTSGQSGFNREFLQMVSFPARVNFLF